MDCRKRRQNCQIEQSVWLKEKLHVCFHFCVENGLEVSTVIELTLVSSLRRGFSE